MPIVPIKTPRPRISIRSSPRRASVWIAPCDRQCAEDHPAEGRDPDEPELGEHVEVRVVCDLRRVDDQVDPRQVDVPQRVARGKKKFPVPTPVIGWFLNIWIDTRQRSSRPVPEPTENFVTWPSAWGGATSE